MFDGLKKISSDHNALPFLIYKGIEGAMNGLEEYKIGKNSIVYPEKLFEKNAEQVINGYLQDLPILERTIFKTVLSLPWSDTVRLLSEMFLDFGKNNDGSYKSTIDVIKNGLKYLGSE